MHLSSVLKLDEAQAILDKIHARRKEKEGADLQGEVKTKRHL